jgi:hypothetical protein
MKSKFGKAYENLPPHHRHFSSPFKRAFETNKHRFGTGDTLVPMRLHMEDVDQSLKDMYDHRDGEVILT